MGRTALSKRELSRSGMLARVNAGDLRLKDAGVLMRVSYRQAKRLWVKYRKGGAAGLKHGNVGKASHRARPAKQRRKILKLVQEKYGGFGPTLAAEHLASEDNQPVHVGDFEAVDAGGGAVDACAQGAAASPAARAQSAFR